jgi:hypothetical protein
MEVVKITNEMTTMLITFFDIKGIVHFELISQSQSTKLSYVDILKWLCEALHRKRPNLWPNK